MKLLLTGGCGFIGSAVVRHLLRNTDHVVINVDKMTYAASEDALEEARGHNRHVLIRADIADGAAMRQVFATHQPDAVMHLAAESHVDRSIDGPAPFIQTNVVGTFTLLEAARHYCCARWARRGAQRSASTTSPPTKCSARSGRTTRRSTRPRRTTRAVPIRPARRPPTIWCAPGSTPTGCRRSSSNTANNYGPWQFPEKLIPLVTLNALEGKPLPVYGDGSNRRDWMFVEDHAAALVRVLEHGQPGATYAIGARQPRSNLQVVRAICAAAGSPAARSGRAARAADPIRHRPSGPRFPLRDRPVADRGGAGLDGAARFRGRAWRAPSTGIWRIATGGRRARRALCRAALGHCRHRGPRHEGHPAGRRLRHAAASDDAGGVQAAAAGLRQADGLLPAVDADAGGHPRHPGDLHARRTCRSSAACSATARASACASTMPSSRAPTASPRPS